MDKELFEHNKKVIKMFLVGCNHISAIKKETRIDNGDKYHKDKTCHDFHDFKNLSEFDYLKNYSVEYFSPFVAIELENSIKDQLAAVDYVRKIINKIKFK